MLALFTRRTLIIIGGVLLAAGGVVLGAECDGNFCDPHLNSRCYKSQAPPETDLCCLDADQDQVYHCVTCSRDIWICDDYYPYLGPAYNCVNPGEVCNQ